MAHEPLPPVPVIDLPKEVAEALVADGLAEPAPNIHTFSAVTDYSQGILLITGGVASGIPIRDALSKVSTLPLFPTWSFTLFPTGLRDSFYSMAAPFTRRRVASSSLS
jgi:hypothetical protein